MSKPPKLVAQKALDNKSGTSSRVSQSDIFVPKLDCYYSFLGPIWTGVSEQLKKNTNKHEQYYPKEHKHKRTSLYF